MDNQVEKNISIMYLRVIATAFIFIDHALAYTDMPGKSIIIQITNSGVLIFLMISGFLYGGKTIGDMVGWLKNRVLRLYIPYFIFIIVYYLCMFVQGKFVLKSFLTYLFMFQGILGTENGPHTLWFMTLLLMCYCLIPLLQFIRKYIDENKIAFNSVYFAVCVLLLFILQIMLAYNCNITLDFGHYLSWYIMAFAIFIFGYIIGGGWKIQTYSSNTRFLIILTCIMIISMFVRVCSRYNIDGTLLYDRVISIWTNVILDIWIFFFVYYFTKNQSFWRRNGLKKVVKSADNLSYYFYLVHKSVLAACAFVTPNQYMIVLCGFILSIISARLLLILTDIVVERIKCI